MKSIGALACALLAAAMLTAAPASANTCMAGKLSCATTMPVDGYCECTSHGMTQDGTVVARPTRGQPMNGTAGGCGANPEAPGCR